MFYIYNYISNHHFIYGIPHASQAHCRASQYTNKSAVWLVPSYGMKSTIIERRVTMETTKYQF